MSVLRVVLWTATPGGIDGLKIYGLPVIWIFIFDFLAEDRLLSLGSVFWLYYFNLLERHDNDAKLSAIYSLMLGLC